ncbi:MAG: DUF1638 domain-containing protein [Bacillota bacterium]|nr:DUF1638 domain-containing protein [Bacillota bacterium]
MGRGVAKREPDLVITCQPLAEVVSVLAGGRVPLHLVDSKLHRSPPRLHDYLQQLIEDNPADCVVLAMGLCGGAASDLVVKQGALVLPRVDDCLALLLGSQESYRQQAGECPGTYYLSKGWLDCPDNIVAEYERCVERRGPDGARRVFRSLIGNYRRLVYIEAGLAEEECFACRAQSFAGTFDLEFHRRPADLRLLANLVRGKRDPRTITFPAGKTTSVLDFLIQAPCN